MPAALCLALFIVSCNLFTMVALLAPVVRGIGTTVGTVQVVLVLLSLVAAAYGVLSIVTQAAPHRGGMGILRSQRPPA
jgi:hypothetical protein